MLPDTKNREKNKNRTALSLFFSSFSLSLLVTHPIYSIRFGFFLSVFFSYKFVRAATVSRLTGSSSLDLEVASAFARVAAFDERRANACSLTLCSARSTAAIKKKGFRVKKRKK